MRFMYLFTMSALINRNGAFASGIFTPKYILSNKHTTFSTYALDFPSPLAVLFPIIKSYSSIIFQKFSNSIESVCPSESV